MAMRTADSPSRVREASLDNAKALLIVLVVLGHAIEDVARDDLAEGLYRAIYLFHMPAFALITGYLSRGFRASVGSYLKLAGTLLVPYLVFQVAHAGINGWLDRKPIEIDLLHPEWTMWYLVAVAFWRLVTPVFRALPFAVPVAFLIALGFGLVPNLPHLLALDRTLTLLPFFVIGLALTPEGLARIRRFGAVPLGVIFVPVAVAVSWWSLDQLGGDDFWFSRSFVQLGDDSAATGFMLRLASYAFGLLGTAWVLTLASRRKLPLTFIGINSLYVYLLHSVTLAPFRDRGVVEGRDEPWLLIMSVAVALGLSALLASKPVTVITRFVIQPPFGKLGKPGKASTQPAPASLQETSPLEPVPPDPRLQETVRLDAVRSEIDPRPPARQQPRPQPTQRLQPAERWQTSRSPHSARPTQPSRQTQPGWQTQSRRQAPSSRPSDPARRPAPTPPASPARRARPADDDPELDQRTEVRPRRAAESVVSAR